MEPRMHLKFEAANFYIVMVPVLTLSKSLKGQENVRFFRPEKVPAFALVSAEIKIANI